MDTLVE